MGPKRARRAARFSQLAIVAAREAVADAGLDTTMDPDRTAVIVNSACAGTPETERNVRTLVAKGPKDVSPYYVPQTILNMAACEVAIDLKVHGPVNASALACASGTAALLEARRLIATGEADVVIAGGTDAAINEAMFAGLSVMGPLSERNDAPAEASRPFDADRDGFVFGEGAVIMVVESAEHARSRGAAAYGTIAGGALTSDAFHMSAPEPSGTHAARAISLALGNAGVAPTELDYICAHGTATKANDAAETKAIRIALGEAADGVRRAPPSRWSATSSAPPGRCRRWSACWRCATASSRRRPTCTPLIRPVTWTMCRSRPARPRCAWPPPTPSASVARTA